MRKLCLLSLLFTGCFQAAAANWPGGMGPDGTGLCPEPALPIHWSTSQNIRWRLSLPGPGSSSPIAWSNRVMLVQVDQDCATVMCLDRADGSLLWQSGLLLFEPGGRIITPPPCSATPVTDGDRVFALLGSILVCYDFAGELLWERDIAGVVDRPGWISASPILQGDLCIVASGDGKLVALTKTSGATAWEVEAPNAGPSPVTPQGGPGATPLVILRAGHSELVHANSERVAAYNPGTGRLLWSRRAPPQAAQLLPVWGEGLLACLAGADDTQSFTVIHDGGIGRWQRLRQLESANDGLISGAIFRNHLFTLSHRGLASCHDLQNGACIWQVVLRGPGRDTGTGASLLLAGDTLYAGNRSGDVFVYRAGPRLESLATNSLHEASTASLAASDNQLFIRTDTSLWCVGDSGASGSEVGVLRSSSDECAVGAKPARRPSL